MPQASDAQRALMAKWFPRTGLGGDNSHGTDDSGPIQFLEARGWVFERSGMIRKPTPSHNPSMYEIECLRFLHDEWDYDWYKPLFQPLYEEEL